MRILGFFFVLLMVFIPYSGDIYGQKNTIKDLERQREKKNKEIQKTGEKLEETHQTCIQLLSSLNTLTEQLKKRKKHLDFLNREINTLNEKIGEQSLVLMKMEEDFKRGEKDYVSSIKKIYFWSRFNEKWYFVLSVKTFSQFYTRLRYLKEYSAWQEKRTWELKQEMEKLQKVQKELSSTKQEKEKVLVKYEEEKRQLDKEEKQQKILLSSLQKQEKNLKKELEKKHKEARELDRKIEEIIREEERKRRDKQSHTSSKENNTIIEKDLQLSSSFASNKGKLPIPIKGVSFRVVGHFGIRRHEQFRNITLNNSGVDLQTEQGAEARAVFNGVVTKVFSIPGSGGSIIVRHGSYLSVYSNLSKIYVKSGDKVDTRQPLGVIAPNIAYGGKPVLHFQIWKETTKLNPELWLAL
ncbi:MAG TPA: hypothetical protein DDY68_01325 [Porphyromonadaceae bacterium]|nr:hypothetical protein [Porphyromonadaceae bacterium]